MARHTFLSRVAQLKFSPCLARSASMARHPHKITELVKKTKITQAYLRNFSSLLEKFLQCTGEISPAYWRDFSSLLEISPAYWRNFSSLLERFLQPTGEISPAYWRNFSSLLERFLQPTGEISPAYWRLEKFFHPNYFTREF